MFFHKMSIPFIYITTGLYLFSCGIQDHAGSGSEAGNSTRTRIAYLDDSLFIKIPSSATGDTAKALLKSLQKTPQQQTTKFYAIVRGYIGLANAFIHNNSVGIKKLIRTYRDSIPWDYVEKHSSLSVTKDTIRWTAVYNPNDEFPYQLEVTALNTVPEQTAFSLLFNGSQSSPKGQAFYRMDLLNPQESNGALSIQLSFEAQGTVKKLQLTATSDSIIGDTHEGFKKLSMELYANGSVVHLSGASYHPQLFNLLPDTSEYCYAFYGFADPLNDLSVLFVGLPPATVNSDNFSLFSTYSLSSIIAQKAVRSDLQLLNDTLKQIIVTSYKDSLTIKAINDSIMTTGMSWLHPASEMASITISDFYTCLELNKNSDSQDIIELLWYRSLQQPVYFNTTGYAGNGDEIPPAFAELVLTEKILTVQNPWLIKNLIITP